MVGMQSGKIAVGHEERSPHVGNHVVAVEGPLFKRFDVRQQRRLDLASTASKPKPHQNQKDAQTLIQRRRVLGNFIL
jgi:hypothetical protein